MNKQNQTTTTTTAIIRRVLILSLQSIFNRHAGTISRHPGLNQCLAADKVSESCSVTLASLEPFYP